MYMIEMHKLNSAHTTIVLEKGDATKPYEQFSNYKLIINHAGDADERTCRFCAVHRRTALLRERRAAAELFKC